MMSKAAKVRPGCALLYLKLEAQRLPLGGFLVQGGLCQRMGSKPFVVDGQLKAFAALRQLYRR